MTLPVETNYNDGIMAEDLLNYLPEPTCDSDGYKEAQTYYPGIMFMIGE